MARSGSETSVSFAWARRIPATTWKLITQTVGTCLRYRVTGLAAEAAFFAILSLPPLIFGLAGSIGFIAGRFFDVETIDSIKLQIADLAGRALTADSVSNVIVPTIDKVLDGGRPDVISIGFLLALWSGSRALNVFVDTITIMYGMGGKRGIVRTRALSFSLYCAALVIGVIVLPLVLAGPDAVDALLPQKVDFLNQLYWPVVTILSAGFLNTLFHLSVPVRTPWVSDLPGSFLTLSIWIGGSFVLRWILQSTVGGTSIYGPLAAPIAVLMWLYMTAIAVLIGAALNAVVDRLWPHKSRKVAQESDEDVQAPVMKAEPDPHHVDVVEPGEQRPEIKAALAVEALSEAEPAEHAVPASVPIAATKLPAVAKTVPGKTVPGKTALGKTAPSKVSPAEPAPAVRESVRPGVGKASSAKGEPVVPAAGVPDMDGGEREPERVGKSGAQADGDDLV
ncbi:YihY/virulence factor BrkB family protein [Kribbella qitaiheensis]|uniref:YihY/virulence factor BrkB family protein n=1 Tax=Kribbella qitaiheensis TaxID=1544730 RepID=A0A7G6WTZ6_9ACTN|nr:YihY/virulence factor BrkB family protein [Kribbella qitaiheensis]QNE17461.1 YihY/virulence factor BrkB family protein [Kribbella qitaiheensis]